MSNTNPLISGPASATRTATGAGPETGSSRKGRSLCQAQSQRRSGWTCFVALIWSRRAQVWSHCRHSHRVA